MVTMDSRLVGELGVYIHDMWMTPVNIIGTSFHWEYLIESSTGMELFM